MAIKNTALTTTATPIYVSAGNSAISTVHLCNYSGSPVQANIYLAPSTGNVANANTAIYANITTAQAVATSSAAYGNSAFLQANTPSYVSNSAASYANSAFSSANNATDQSVAFAIALG